MHTIDSAMVLIRQIEPVLAANGYHCALTGSVLFKGESEKDIDIVLYPHNPDKLLQPIELLDLLEPFLSVANDYTEPQYKRPIAIMKHESGRVDLFFF